MVGREAVRSVGPDRAFGVRNEGGRELRGLTGTAGVYGDHMDESRGCRGLVGPLERPELSLREEVDIAGRKALRRRRTLCPFHSRSPSRVMTAKGIYRFV